jgi:hypothetical protein
VVIAKTLSAFSVCLALAVFAGSSSAASQTGGTQAPAPVQKACGFERSHDEKLCDIPVTFFQSQSGVVSATLLRKGRVIISAHKFAPSGLGVIHLTLSYMQPSGNYILKVKTTAGVFTRRLLVAFA